MEEAIDATRKKEATTTCSWAVHLAADETNLLDPRVINLGIRRVPFLGYRDS